MLLVVRVCCCSVTSCSTLAAAAAAAAVVLSPAELPPVAVAVVVDAAAESASPRHRVGDGILKRGSTLWGWGNGERRLRRAGGIGGNSEPGRSWFIYGVCVFF